ncbi:MAG: transcriptional regulator [Rubricoccaceae bacterium]
MSSPEPVLTYRFDDFLLDVPERRLWRGAERVDLNPRYFDALVLLVQARGRLVRKDDFFAEVWGDVVVSDSALTQCVKDIRRALGDDAARPRYVETVPRHGYRFVGRVEEVDAPGAEPPGRPGTEAAGVAGKSAPPGAPLLAIARQGLAGALAGALGGGAAGVFGGLLYGFAVADGPAGAGLGAASALVVLLALNVLVGTVGGAGVGAGLASAKLVARRAARSAPEHAAWRIAGAALGGLLVGTGAKLLGVDAFNLLFGTAPRGITGGPEGAALGAALALGMSLGARRGPSREVVAAAALCAAAGTLIPPAGGSLMGGSLALLGEAFAGSRIDLDALGRLFGEAYFGPAAQAAFGSIEGMLFGGGVAGALVLARRLGLAGPPRAAPRPTAAGGA